MPSPMQILNQDDQSLTVMGPQGPMRIAKNLLDQQTQSMIGLPQQQPIQAPSSQQDSMPMPTVGEGVSSLFQPEQVSTRSPFDLSNNQMPQAAQIQPAQQQLPQEQRSPAEATNQQMPGNVSFNNTASQNAANNIADMSGQLAKLNGNSDDDETTIRDNMAKGAKAVSDQSNYLTGMQNQILKQQADQAQQHQEFNNEFHNQFAQYNKDVQDFAKSQAINPRQYINNMSMGDKLASALSIGMGSIAQGLGAKSNIGMDLLNKAIDDNILAQKSEIEKKSNSLGFQGNMLSQLRAKFGDDVQAENALRQLQLGQAEVQVKKMMATTDSVEKQNNGLKMIAELRASGQKQGASAANVLLRQMIQQKMNNGIPVDLEAAPEDIRKDFGPRAVDVGGGKQYLARSEEDSKDVKKYNVSADKSIGLIKELSTMAQPRFMPSKDKAVADQKAKELALELKNLSGITRFTESENNLFNEMIGDPNSIYSAQTKARLKSVEDSILKNRELLYKNKLQNYKPVGMACGGMVKNYDDGGKIPGKAKVSGDSVKNDTVPIKASPGEIVLPRTLALKGSPLEIMQFIMKARQGK